MTTSTQFEFGAVLAMLKPKTETTPEVKPVQEQPQFDTEAWFNSLKGEWKPEHGQC